jgi:hypothetical protein
MTLGRRQLHGKELQYSHCSPSVFVVAITLIKIRLEEHVAYMGKEIQNFSRKTSWEGADFVM